MKPLKPILSSNIYFPGLISIILLPLVGLVYLSFYQAKYAIPVSWFDQKAVDRLSETYNQKMDLEDFRKYEKLYFTGDEPHDKLELDTLKQTIRFLTTQFGLKNGICIYLTAKTKYQDIVTVLDVCQYYKVLSVIPFNDKIFVFKYNNAGDILWQQKVVKLPPDAYGDDIADFPPQYTFLQSIKMRSKELLYNIKSFWPCLIPFTGMFYFWRKRNKWRVE